MYPELITKLTIFMLLGPLQINVRVLAVKTGKQHSLNIISILLQHIILLLFVGGPNVCLETFNY